MGDNLKNVLTGVGAIPDADWELFHSILREERITKNEFLLTEGKVCPGIYFLVQGCLRTYRLIDGKEVNTAFHFENDFVCELESLSTGTPSHKFIQTLEDSRTIFIPKAQLIGLYQNSTSFQELGRKILEQVAITEQKYSSLFTLYSPQDRYAYILENYPHLIQRVPLQYLASYLGIARETLSRIRKRMA
ncbi:Crp/Fnr family transcriptional regulator [Salmonirosea aquatica]|uniref:Cyclic nucleotide-binding domain-containing protein n=1 Tax=Salmonirosea aquatica TaxID=2654236 RepID=A0A7C9BC19_9BACT|nr:cyclic nucleotide-binding domain-containing protein [Cytophagaceae bacterium SJW1-29]